MSYKGLVFAAAALAATCASTAANADYYYSGYNYSSGGWHSGYGSVRPSFWGYPALLLPNEPKVLATADEIEWAREYEDGRAWRRYDRPGYAAMPGGLIGGAFGAVSGAFEGAAYGADRGSSYFNRPYYGSEYYGSADYSWAGHGSEYHGSEYYRESGYGSAYRGSEHYRESGYGSAYRGSEYYREPGYGSAYRGSAYYGGAGNSSGWGD